MALLGVACDTGYYSMEKEFVFPRLLTCHLPYCMFLSMKSSYIEINTQNQFICNRII